MLKRCTDDSIHQCCVFHFFSFQQGKKGDSFQSLVQVEFDGTVLGESEEKQSDSTRHCVDYKFICLFHCPSDAHVLSDIAQKPIVCELSLIIFPFLLLHDETESGANRKHLVSFCVLLQFDQVLFFFAVNSYIISCRHLL